MSDYFVGSWQHSPNWAISVPTASYIPAGSSVCACKWRLQWYSVLESPAESLLFIAGSSIHPPMHPFIHSTFTQQILNTDTHIKWLFLSRDEFWYSGFKISILLAQKLLPKGYPRGIY
jgi:hypothetical protein